MATAMELDMDMDMAMAMAELQAWLEELGGLQLVVAVLGPAIIVIMRRGEQGLLVLLAAMLSAKAIITVKQAGQHGQEELQLQVLAAFTPTAAKVYLPSIRQTCSQNMNYVMLGWQQY